MNARDGDTKKTGTQAKKNSSTRSKNGLLTKKFKNQERLEGARFRYINEMLYTSHSKVSTYTSQ